MKKIVFLLLLLMPFIVYGESFQYTIETKVSLDGKELEGDDFTFDLINSDGEIVQTKKNDKDGNVIFDPISFQAEDATNYYTAASNNGGYTDLKNKYYFYLIKQRNDNVKGMTYDEETGYVGVYIYDDGTSRVDYLKNVDKIKKDSLFYKTKENAEVFHATEEELQGQAYAVFDPETATLTFFRDEVGKYTDKQVVEGKTYYTDFEGSTYNPSWLRYNVYYSSSNFYGNSTIKKIVFNDPIKPSRISTGGEYNQFGWFAGMENLEEVENINLLDTSLVTTMNAIFRDVPKLKSLDLSRWDTSNVYTMYMMFANCYALEEVYTDNFDLSKVYNASYMFESDRSLKWINYESFNFPNLRNGDQLLWGTEQIVGIDASSWGITNSMATSSMFNTMKSLVYLNVSSFPGVWSEGIAGGVKLAIVDLPGSFDVLYSNIGPYGSYWYNINTNTLYSRDELRTHLSSTMDLDPGTYVRPNNNTEPFSFSNKYYNPETNSNLLTNPNTRDRVLIVLSLFVISVLAYFYYRKRKVFYE